MEEYVTTAEAARLIDCVDSRVRQLLRAGKITGRRFGPVWLVLAQSARDYRDARNFTAHTKTSPASLLQSK